MGASAIRLVIAEISADGSTRVMEEASRGILLGRLVEFMGFTRIGEAGHRIRYQATGRDASIVDIVREPNTARGGLGSGIVHHIAFRTPTDEQQERWRRELMPRVREILETFWRRNSVR